MIKYNRKVVFLAFFGFAIFNIWNLYSYISLPSKEVSLDDLPSIFLEVAESGEIGSFAAFVVLIEDGESLDAINIQFSYEDDKVGLDWVLIGPSNIRDRSKVERYIKSAGLDYEIRFLNDVKYLRVTEGDLVGLCRGVLRDIYNVLPNDRFGVVYSKIEL